MKMSYLTPDDRADLRWKLDRLEAVLEQIRLRLDDAKAAAKEIEGLFLINREEPDE